MKKIKSKKNLFILVLLIVISSTVAYLYSTDTFQNIFVAASYKVTVVETFESPDNWKPGDTTPKTVTLKNEGTVPIKVRVKLEEEWKDSNNQDLPLQYNDENVAIINFSNEDDYIYKDGYYYYDLALQPGETTSSIIESVTFNPNYSGTVTCIENDDNTHTCSSSDSGYEGGTYKLTITIEGVQEDFYVQAWGLSSIVERQYLYDVLKNESESNGLARKYTGEHHDSFTEEPSKDIYHWYGSNNYFSNLVLERNNVIFGDYCWVMIRTTDTGGVKMLYNGEVEENKCLNTRGTHVGYSGNSTKDLLPTYWYGTDYIYDSINKNFSLSGEVTTGTIQTRQYTCLQTTADSTCTILYYVDRLYNNNSYYVLRLNGNSVFSYYGTLSFNQYSGSLGYVGYMFNDIYSRLYRNMVDTESVLSSSSISTSYWYADSATWGNPTANRYNLSNPYQISSTADYSNLVGKYTFGSTDQNYVGTYVYYIVAVNNSTMYYIRHEYGNDMNNTYTFGDSYTDNGNGTYTINNPTTLSCSEWYASTSTRKNKYVCKNAVNNTCNYLWFISSTNKSGFYYTRLSNNYKYAKDFIWDGSKYVLKNDSSVTFFEWKDDNIEYLNNAHYTCLNESGECTTLLYLYALSGNYLYYIQLTNGISGEDAISGMLYNDDVNKINSTIKTGIDAWFEKYLISYSDYLEDTIFCNDRSQINEDTNGWNSNGGNLNEYLQFKEYNATNDLSCQNETDKFSTLNDKAKLKYKIGLMSSPEMNILNNNIIRDSSRSGQFYWLSSPYYFGYESAMGHYISPNIGILSISSTSGVKPAISLKPKTEYESGDGSRANPYVVKMN